MEFQGKVIIISNHATCRAHEREVTLPEQVYQVICTGKMKRLGKHILKFVKQAQGGSIICICEEVGNKIVVKTIERNIK